jgi:hypothetical protein
MLALLQSRKFKLAVIGIMGLVTGGLTGELTWAQVAGGSALLIVSNILGIAVEDMGKLISGRTPPWK